MADVDINMRVVTKDALRSVKNFTSKFEKSISGAFEKVSSNINLVGVITDVNQAFELLSRGISSVQGALDVTVNSFADFEQALVGVRKTTNFSSFETDAFGKSIRDLSKDIPVTTAELLAIGQSAGQLGVTGVDNILNFTETIARLGSASNVSGEEAATSLARILNVSGEAVDNIDELASVIVALGNNFAASEGEIISVTNEIARGIGIFGVASSQSAALATSLRSLGVRAELAGGVSVRAFNEINNAINESGPRLELLSALTGRAGDTLREAFDQDAVGVFRDFIAGLGQIEGSKINVFLEEFGITGTEASKVIPPLVKNIENFDAALKLANDEQANATALLKESEQAFKTTNAELQVAKNRFSDLGTEIGGALNPAVLRLIKSFNLLLLISAENTRAVGSLFTVLTDPIFGTIDAVENLIGVIKDGTIEASKSIGDLVKDGTALEGLVPTALAQRTEDLNRALLGLDEQTKEVNSSSLETAKSFSEVQLALDEYRQSSEAAREASEQAAEQAKFEAKRLQDLRKSLESVRSAVQSIQDEQDPVSGAQRAANERLAVLVGAKQNELIEEEEFARSTKAIREELARDLVAIEAEKNRDVLSETRRGFEAVKNSIEAFNDSLDPVGALARQAQDDIAVVKEAGVRIGVSKQETADLIRQIEERLADAVKKIREKEKKEREDTEENRVKTAKEVLDALRAAEAAYAKEQSDLLKARQQALLDFAKGAASSILSALSGASNFGEAGELAVGFDKQAEVLKQALADVGPTAAASLADINAEISAIQEALRGDLDVSNKERRDLEKQLVDLREQAADVDVDSALEVAKIKSDIIESENKAAEQRRKQEQLARDAATGLLKDGVSAAVEAAFPGFGGLAGQTFEVLTQDPEDLKLFIEALVDQIPVIIDAVVDNIPVLILALVRAAPELARALSFEIPIALAKTLPPAMAEIFAGVAADATNVLSEPFAAASEGFNQFFRELQNGFGEVFTKLGLIFKGTFDDAIKDVGKLFIKIMDLIFKTIPKKISQAFKGVGDSLKDALDAFKEFFANLDPSKSLGGVGDVGDIGDKIVSGIKVAAGGTVLQSAQAVFPDVKLFAKGGEIPAGFPNDTFPARLTSGENVIDRSLSDSLRNYLSLVDSDGLPVSFPEPRQQSSFDGSAALDTMSQLISESDQGKDVTIVLQVGEQELSKVLVNLNRQGFRTS